jgi:hypothetical protein
MAIEVHGGGVGKMRGTKKIGEAWVRVRWRRVEIIFGEPRGYGERGFELRVQPTDFEPLAKAMMHANSEMAIKAFGAALQIGPIAARPEEEEHLIVFPPDAVPRER